jgi:hypothetical protein
MAFERTLGLLIVLPTRLFFSFMTSFIGAGKIGMSLAYSHREQWANWWALLRVSRQYLIMRVGLDGALSAFVRQTGIRRHETNANQVPPELLSLSPSDAPLLSSGESRVFPPQELSTFKLLMGIEIAHKLKVLDQQTQINLR